MADVTPAAPAPAPAPAPPAPAPNAQAIKAAIADLSRWVEEAARISDMDTAERARGIAEKLAAAAGGTRIRA
jgi:hypothetical protein